ncbi:serine/threonine-protein kinase [Sorangium sp. So ce693]|uniref:serine/threonine-protein kinase n=1 Tax=Sorangium sp. So ce693 TaxID=3133318 RepID=UPI003F61A6C8
MARGLPTALVTWPTFAALDVFVVLAVFPSASVARLLLYRLLGEVILLWLYLLARREQTSAELLDAAHVFAVWSTGGLISVMALEFGDLTWNYMHGLSIVMLVDATILPTHFSRSLRMTIPVALSFPIIMGAGASLDPALAAQWTSPRSLVIFACNYIFVLATAILVSAASHGLWSARQQVYEARKLGRYRLVAPVGRGGQNEVWLAWDESLRRDVALKLLRSESKSEGDVRSFEREARATSRLTSPHTIRIFDFGASSDGIFYIAMEHLAGADLATLVRDHGPMPPSRVVHFARQACLSLAEAHDAGVIHRDIKPHNLYITRVGDDQDVLKVLDFGIAKQVSLEGDASMTDVGVIKGTPTYMSPEMISAGAVDARSDIYSLGVTLYYLLTGVAPFDGRTFGKLVYSHLTMPPIPPSLRAPWPLSSELEDVVMRCLAKRPGDRYQSARELLAALDACEPTPSWTPDDARSFWTARAAMPRAEPPPPDPGPTVRLRPEKAVPVA